MSAALAVWRCDACGAYLVRREGWRGSCTSVPHSRAPYRSPIGTQVHDEVTFELPAGLECAGTWLPCDDPAVLALLRLGGLDAVYALNEVDPDPHGSPRPWPEFPLRPASDTSAALTADLAAGRGRAWGGLYGEESSPGRKP